MITDSIRTNRLGIPDHPGVKIKPANTEIDRNRNWALRQAEELVKKSPKAHDKTVTVQKAEGRGVYVNDALVFSQSERYARDGVFQGEFAGLSLR